MANIVLIDDIQANLDELREAINSIQNDAAIELRCWMPSAGDESAVDGFNRQIDDETILVITDYDLTGNGQTGLFGSTIVDWCNRKLIPVGDYSRANKGNLPKEPNQYEIRVPQDSTQAAQFILSVFEGFTSIRDALAVRWDTLSQKRSPAAILADILERPLEESSLALYGIKIGSPNSSLMDSITQDVNVDAKKQRFIGYVLGHLLLNVILRFPGSIVNLDSLAAFLAIARTEVDGLSAIFQPALYRGPFSTTEPLYWLSDVEDILDNLQADLDIEETASVGKINRMTLERALGRTFARHECPRCGGDQGGFICAFTQKTICPRGDCSVASNAWIPQGARLCRIEKTYYDEWAPMLGF